MQVSLTQKPIEGNDNFATKVRDFFPEINETLEAVAFDNTMNQLFRVPVSEVVQKLQDEHGVKYLVLDGIITQRLIDACSKAGVQYIVGHRMAELKKANELTLRTFNELGVN
ncbi:MAG: DNA primase DnaG, partial [Nitrososphaerales archaeon]